MERAEECWQHRHWSYCSSSGAVALSAGAISGLLNGKKVTGPSFHGARAQIRILFGCGSTLATKSLLVRTHINQSGTIWPSYKFDFSKSPLGQQFRSLFHLRSSTAVSSKAATSRCPSVEPEGC